MNHKTSGILTLFVTAILLPGGPARADFVADLRGGFGYDSNAFDLNDSIGERDGIYTELEFDVGAENKAASGWIKRLDAGATARLFESKMSDADEGNLFVRARGESAEKYGENGWSWSVRTGLREQTYVSRLTGEVATDGAGNEIDERYNSLSGELRGGWRFPGSDFGRFSLEGSAIYRDYTEDYDEFGLERLDYYEYGLAPTFERPFGEDQLRLRLKAEERAYVDRRVSDAFGAPVAGTDLKYRYYGIDARFQHRLTPKTVLELTGGYDIREDNGVGFGDRTQWDAGIEWTWRAPGDARLQMETRYSSREFDNQAIGDPTINDEAPDKKGWDVIVRYARPFPLLDIRGFSLIAEGRLETYDNNDDIRYTYDRWVGFVGVRKEF